MTNKSSCEKNNNVKKITVIYTQSKEERCGIGLYCADIYVFMSVAIMPE
jgi:hypothetical protein